MQNPLISLLAGIDGLFSPLRGEWVSPGPTAIVERREDFRRFGLPIPKTGGDASERKASERRLDQLEKSKQVIFFRNRGRRTHWKLPDQVDWQLRRQATSADFDEMLSAMIALQAFEDIGCTTCGMVPEWFIALPPKANTQTLRARNSCLRVEDAMLAGLVRNLIASWSSGRGCVCYCLTPEGRNFLDSPVAPDITWPEYDATAFDLYFNALQEAKASRMRWKSLHPGHIAIPLSEGDWPSFSKRRGLPGILTTTDNIRKPKTMVRAILKSMK